MKSIWQTGASEGAGSLFAAGGAVTWGVFEEIFRQEPRLLRRILFILE